MAEMKFDENSERQGTGIYAQGRFPGKQWEVEKRLVKE